MNAANRSYSIIREARHARGLTQERAAVEARISLSWLRQVERDPSLLSPAIAQRLLPVLGLEPEAVR